MSLAPGSRLGVYEVIAPIGAGGMGEVYRARDSKLRRDVALKVLPAAFASDPDRLARFEREAYAVAALSHPNILAIHDFGRDNGISYAVMELLEGHTLREALANGALPRRKALDYGRQIAQALAAAHARGIVHRDLKPENVFVTTGGHVKVLDFGLASDAAGCGRHAGGDRDRHPGRHGARDSRLHVAGAGSRRNGRSSFGHLLLRLRVVRDGVGPARVCRRIVD
jgi:serine/threonine protein kinase